jgi:hypothetical protein
MGGDSVSNEEAVSGRFTAKPCRLLGRTYVMGSGAALNM